jgi:hypothetical protein
MFLYTRGLHTDTNVRENRLEVSESQVSAHRLIQFLKRNQSDFLQSQPNLFLGHIQCARITKRTEMKEGLSVQRECFLLRFIISRASKDSSFNFSLFFSLQWLRLFIQKKKYPLLNFSIVRHKQFYIRFGNWGFPLFSGIILGISARILFSKITE